MSWVPLDLITVCAHQTTITACQSSAYVFLQLIATLLGQFKENSPAPNPANPVRNRQKSASEVNNSQDQASEGHTNEYDFIIVGAGTAGCTLANRLSEEQKWNVLLIEAGEEEPQIVDIPSYALVTQRSNIDWNYATQPQPNSCEARPEGRCIWSGGKVLGGSSSIGYMIYLRGGPKDYDEWGSLGGAGWSYKKLLPYFIKSEQNNNIEKVDKKFHGTNGEVSIEYFPYQDQTVNRLLDAYQELGLEVFDQNSDRQLGTSLMQHYTRDGLRVSANDAFIRPIKGKRKNLFVLTDALVTKVLINLQTKAAYGVEYFRNGTYFEVFAKKEVIVSAGTISTPKLLMLSGVGPARQLHDLNIKVIQDVSVGSNLQDHVTADGPVISFSNKVSTIVSSHQQILDIRKYQQLRRGPLAGTSTMQVNAFIQSEFENDKDRPDIQFIVDPIVVEDYYADPVLYGAANVRSLSYYTGLMIRPVLLAPKSRGYVELNETDPVFGDPVIYSNTFTVEEDIDRMVDGTKKIVNIVNTEAMQKLGATLVTTPVPGCTHTNYSTDEYWRCLFTSYTAGSYHPVGTCRMGAIHDGHAVVDPKTLNVYGVKRLRVIDASVMPAIPRANINAATMMIAERGADFIKKDWQQLGYEESEDNELIEESRDFISFYDDF